MTDAHLADLTARYVRARTLAEDRSDHASHDRWALVTEPGVVWCRDCQTHYRPEPVDCCPAWPTCDHPSTPSRLAAT